MNGVNQIHPGPSGPVRAEGEDPEELGHSVHVSLQQGLCCHSYPNPSTSDSSLQKGFTLPPIPLAADHMGNPGRGREHPKSKEPPASTHANTERQLVTGGTREATGQRTLSTHPALKSQGPRDRPRLLLCSVSAPDAPGVLVRSLSFTLGSSSKKSLCVVILPRQSCSNPCPPLLHPWPLP